MCATMTLEAHTCDIEVKQGHDHGQIYGMPISNSPQGDQQFELVLNRILRVYMYVMQNVNDGQMTYQNATNLSYYDYIINIQYIIFNIHVCIYYTGVLRYI